MFARGSATVLRIEFAHGRITRTVVPALASNGPVSFVATPHAAIIRPLDFVPGFLVPDGRPPYALTGALASGGVLLPGTLSGTTTVPVVNGIATFSDLSIDQPGNGYTLRVTATGLLGAESAAFNIGAF